MKKCLIMLLAVIAMFTQSCSAQGDTKTDKKYAMYGVAFYNQENLFDTIHAKGKNDYDFLPNGMYKWNTLKYESKLKNMSRVLSELCVTKTTPKGAAIIGLSEVENRKVVADLLKQPSLKGRGYRILHFESRDRRGIDCAMLYNPKMFVLEDSLYIPYIYPDDTMTEEVVGFQQGADGVIKALPLFGDTTHITRGFLVGIGRLGGEKLAVIVNHWPSRGAESEARERAAFQCKAIMMALQKQYKDIKVIAMGDLNDDPDNRSMRISMGCKYDPKDIKAAKDIYNPWRYTLRTVGQGTLLYDGKWNLFDQIVLTGNMVDSRMKPGKTTKPSEMYLKRGLTLYSNGIFCPDYLVQQEGRYKGSPLRTSAGGSWLNGYSDHFPTYIYLVKETN